MRKRLNSADGMDLAELLYQTMQAYDFAYLYRNRSVNTQIGGSDQWGNIMSGIDLIKRTNPMLELGEPTGITTPLFSIAGKKMGKSENNAIWLSPLRTTPFDFFYYFYTVPDDEACGLLKLFTAISEEELETTINEHSRDYSKHILQFTLASKLCSIVHSPQISEELCEIMERLSESSFSPTENSYKHINHLFVDLVDSSGTFKEFLVRCFPEIPRRKNSSLYHFR